MKVKTREKWRAELTAAEASIVASSQPNRRIVTIVNAAGDDVGLEERCNCAEELAAWNRQIKNREPLTKRPNGAAVQKAAAEVATRIATLDDDESVTKFKRDNAELIRVASGEAFIVPPDPKPQCRHNPFDWDDDGEGADNDE